MPEIRTDRRSIQYESAKAALQELRFRLPDHRQLQHDLAVRFWHIQHTQGYVAEGAASVVEWARWTGYSASETRLLCRLGRAIAAVPPIWESIAEGHMTPEAAAAIAPLLDDPDLVDEREEWLEAARTKPLRKLRTAVRARIERKQAGDVIVSVVMHVTEDTRVRFARARAVASERVGRWLTDGETLSYVTEDFLERHDPVRKQMQKVPRKRRVGPTADLPFSRYIPAAVQREIRLRAGCRCEFPGCSNTLGLQFAHKHPHAKGSGREAGDLILLCSRHHVLFDSGCYEILRDDEEEFAIRMAGGFVFRESRKRDPPVWLTPEPGHADSVCLPEAVF